MLGEGLLHLSRHWQAGGHSGDMITVILYTTAHACPGPDPSPPRPLSSHCRERPSVLLAWTHRPRGRSSWASSPTKIFYPNCCPKRTQFFFRSNLSAIFIASPRAFPTLLFQDGILGKQDHTVHEVILLRPSGLAHRRCQAHSKHRLMMC